MLMDRIIKAVTFRKKVYAEVESDESFTTTAWILVVAISVVAALGNLSFAHFGRSLLGVLSGAVLNVVGFAIGALIIDVVGRAIFKADVTFQELVRTLGLAYVWRAVLLLMVVVPFLAWCLWPLIVAAVAALLISLAVAVKEALDLGWGQTIITAVLGLIAIAIVEGVARLLLGVIGIPT